LAGKWLNTLGKVKMPVLVVVAGVSFDVLEDKGPIFSLLVLHVKISVFLIQVVTEHVLQESTTVPVTSEDGVPLVDSNAVYVAIDPNQPDVQQLLGQIQVMAAASQVQQANEEESHSLGES